MDFLIWLDYQSSLFLLDDAANDTIFRLNNVKIQRTTAVMEIELRDTLEVTGTQKTLN